MKQTSFYILFLCQTVLVFGASEHGRLIEKVGYNEFQSHLSIEQNHSFVLDSTFDIPEHTQDEKNQKIRAIALICAQLDDIRKKEEINHQLKLFFNHVAQRFLPQLKEVLADKSAGVCVTSTNHASIEELSQLSQVKSLALRLECIGAKGAIQITFDSTSRRPQILQMALCKPAWHSSLHLTGSKPYLTGSVDKVLAQESASFRQKQNPDLHMLTFHENG